MPDVLADILLAALGIILGIVGIVGSIVPVLPGPPLGWLGMLVVHLHFDDSISQKTLFIWLGITIVVTIFDFIVPAKITRLTGGGKAATWGAVIGMLIGMSLTPVGMIIGAFVGALIAELLISKKDTTQALNAALGSFLGFILGTGAKLIVSFWMISIIIGSIL